MKGMLHYAFHGRNSEHLIIGGSPDCAPKYSNVIPHTRQEINNNCSVSLRPSKGSKILTLFISSRFLATFDESMKIILLQLFKNSHSWVDIVFRGNQTELKDSENTMIKGYRLQNEFRNKIFSVSRNLTCEYKREFSSSVLLLTIGEIDGSSEVVISTCSSIVLSTRGEFPKQIKEYKVNITLKPGKQKFLSFPSMHSTQKICFSSRLVNQNLSVFWIDSNYDKYDVFSQLEEIKEETVSSNLVLKQWFGVSLSSTFFKHSVLKRSYFYLSNKVESNKNLNSWGVETEKLSWEKALELCKLYGGTFPYFTSGIELEEFIALMKLFKYFPTFEGVYIGIKQKLVSCCFI